MITHTRRLPIVPGIIPFIVLTACGLGISGSMHSLHAQSARPVIELPELVALAASRQESLIEQRLSVEQTTLGTSAVRAAALPRLDLQSSAFYVSETAEIRLAIPGLPARSIQLGDGTMYEAALSASMPLFTGFRISNQIDALDLQRQSLERSLAASERDLSLAVTAQVREAQFALAQMDILHTHEELTRQLLAQRRLLLNAGQTLPIDTLQIASRIAQLTLDRDAAQVRYERAIHALQRMCAIEHAFDVPRFTDMQSTDPSFFPPVEADVDALLEEAERLRPEFLALRLSERAAESGAAAQRASYLPTVSATASIRSGKPGVDQFANEWMQWGTAGLRLDWNLWSWGADRAAVERAEIDVRKVQSRFRALRMATRARIADAVLAVRLRAAAIPVIERRLELERTRHSLVQARLDEGMALVTDVIEVETTVMETVLRLEQTRIEYALAQAELRAAVGRPL